MVLLLLLPAHDRVYLLDDLLLLITLDVDEFLEVDRELLDHSLGFEGDFGYFY